MSGVLFPMQSAATTGAGTAAAIPPSFHDHNFYIKGSSGVNAGAIQLESADDPTYTGTWNPQGNPITVVASSELSITLAGIFPALRARISTTVTGGTVDVNYVGRRSN